MENKRETLQITQALSGIVSQDVYPDVSSLTAFLELYRYQVPIGQKLIFTPDDTFSILARKLADQPVGGAVADDGGVETIETVEANEATADDLQLKPAVPVAADAYYFGYAYRFSGLTVKYTTAATTGVTIWEYWNGSAWVALSGVTDGTAYWITAAATLDITWTMPTDWAVGGSGNSGTTAPAMFWVRCRVTTAGDVATGDQAWIHPDPTALENVDKFRIEIRDPSELNKKLLIPVAQYRQVVDFQDPEKMYKLDIAEDIEAGENWWVVVMVKAYSPVDVSACYFALTCDRERLALIK